MSLINHYETSKQYEEKKRKKYEIWRMRSSTPLGYVQDNYRTVPFSHGMTNSALLRGVKSNNFEIGNADIDRGFTTRSELSSFRVGSISGFDENRNHDDDMYLNHTQVQRPLDSPSIDNVQRRSRGNRRSNTRVTTKSFKRPSSKGSAGSSERGSSRASSASPGNNWNQSFIHDTLISNYKLSDDRNVGPRLKSFRQNVKKLIDEIERDYRQTRRSRLKLEMRSNGRSHTSQSDVGVLMADLLHDGKAMDSRLLSKSQRKANRSVTLGGRSHTFEDQQKIKYRRRSQSALETRRRINNTPFSQDDRFRRSRPSSAHPSRRYTITATPILKKDYGVDWSTFRLLKDDDDNDASLTEEATFDDCKALLMRLWESLKIPLSIQLDFMEKHFTKWSAFNESAVLSQINRLTVTKQELMGIVQNIRVYEEHIISNENMNHTRQQSLKLLSSIEKWLQNHSDIYPSYQFIWNGKDLIRLLSVAGHTQPQEMSGNPSSETSDKYSQNVSL